MITKNEEKNIEKCIKSYKNIVNEIIVVDTGSTDKTIEIAEKLGAKVYSYEWNDDFAAAKNYSIDMANGEWIIFLDADEYFEKGKETNLLNVIRNIDDRTDIDGIMIKLYNIDKSESDVIDSMVAVRTFRNHKDIRFFGNIHEVIMDDGKDIKCEFVAEEYIKVFHTGYSTNIIDSKVERNLKILKDNFSKGNVRPLDYIYMCDCYMSLHKYDMVIKYAREYLKLNDYVMGYNSKPYQLLITALDQNGCTTDELKSEINEAIKKFPTHPEFYRYLAAVYSTEKKYQLSLETYLKTLKLQDEYNDIEVNNVPSTLFDIYYNIGILYEYKNDYVNALEYYIKSLRKDNKYEKAFERLIKLVKTERDEDIILLLKSIYKDDDENDIKFLVNTLSQMKFGKVLMYYTNMWYSKFGKEDSNLMFMFLSNGEYEEAFKYFSRCYSEEKNYYWELFSVVSALLGKNEKNINYIKEKVKPSFKRIIKACGGNKKIIFMKEDETDYNNILKEFLLIKGNSEETLKIVNLKNRFQNNLSDCIGDLFMNSRNYNVAIEQYMNSIYNRSCNKGDVYNKIGICNYKIYNYEEAVNCFEKALQFGYKKNDIYVTLQWICEQCNDEQLKNRVKKLKD